MSHPNPSPASQPATQELRLPLPKQYLTEEDICHLLATTKRAFRQRPDSEKPPCIVLSPRRRLYDPVEVANWIASLPRTK